jgi:hypothetical protein
MNENLAVAILFVSICSAVVVLIINILNYRIKLKMIKSGRIDENSVKILRDQSDYFKYDTFKWGIILLFAGLGLILIANLSYPDNSPLPFGIETVFVAVGCLIYYFFVQSKLPKIKQ